MHNWLSSQRASAKCDGKANLQIIFSPATTRRNLGAVKRCTQFIWLWKILCFCSKHEHSSFLQKNQNQRCTQVCRSENAWRGRGLIASWNMPVLSVSQSFCLHRVFAQHPHASCLQLVHPLLLLQEAELACWLSSGEEGIHPGVWSCQCWRKKASCMVDFPHRTEVISVQIVLCWRKGLLLLYAFSSFNFLDKYTGYLMILLSSRGKKLSQHIFISFLSPSWLEVERVCSLEYLELNRCLRPALHWINATLSDCLLN